MEGTAEEEDRVTSLSDVLLLSSDDILSSSDVGEYSFGFGFTAKDTPQMLCFAGKKQNDTKLLFSEPSLLSTDSPAPPFSSLDNACVVDDDKSSRSNNKRTGSGDGDDRVCDPKPGKRCKRDQKKPPVKNAKVRKEKLSERIRALQLLVSPYGNTDTASVLHEAMGFIKFLQDQVQVLSSPYFKHHSLLMSRQNDEDTGDVNLMMKVKELKSNGLCLVPLTWTIHVANTNGADLWSPAIFSPTVNQ